jgi:hypothetical protein
MRHTVIAIIPARGGSVRVPRKNVREFCGHPLVAWTIRAALNSETVDEVYLSTDDDEIHDIALSYGIERGHVIRRPDWPDANEAAANRPLLHAVGELEPEWGLNYAMVTLLPTSPQRKPDDIDRGVRHWFDTGGQVSGLHRKRETFIYRDKMGVVAQAIITDKYKRHLESATGVVTIAHPSWYRWFQSKLPSDKDADLNRLMETPDDLPSNQTYYIEVEAWQVPEPDSEEEFGLCELIMEHYVLKGKGIEVYDRSTT